MPEGDSKTLGQRIDELLAPYLRDKAELQGKLDRDLAQRQRLDAQIHATRRDLQVVERSMTDALRNAAKMDAMLAAAFGLRSATESPTAPEPEAKAPEAPAPPAAPMRPAPEMRPPSSPAAKPTRSHPLLNPAA